MNLRCVWGGGALPSPQDVTGLLYGDTKYLALFFSPAMAKPLGGGGGDIEMPGFHPSVTKLVSVIT